jgi:hypothetical protein
LAARIAQIDATDGFFVRNSSVNEVIAVCRQRGIDLTKM